MFVLGTSLALVTVTLDVFGVLQAAGTSRLAINIFRFIISVFLADAFSSVSDHMNRGTNIPILGLCTLVLGTATGAVDVSGVTPTSLGITTVVSVAEKLIVVEASTGFCARTDEFIGFNIAAEVDAPKSNPANGL